MVSSHACLARLLADTGGVWEATATKLRFFLATIGVFVRQEPSPRTPGRVFGPQYAVKPGGGLMVASGLACLARTSADAGAVFSGHIGGVVHNAFIHMCTGSVLYVV